MQNQLPKLKTRCVLCSSALLYSSVDGILLHSESTLCTVVLTDLDGVSIDEDYELEAGVIYERAPAAEAAAVELVTLPMLDLSEIIGRADASPYISVEWALEQIFADAGVPRLGGASGDRGWSSISTYQRCPYLWKRRYIDTRRGIIDKAPKPLALEIGSTIHTFLAVGYAQMIDPEYPLTQLAIRDALVKMMVTPDVISESWRVTSAYWPYYAHDTEWRPLAVEHHLVDPKTKQSCRIDLVMERTETGPGLPVGTYLWDHKCLQGDVEIWDYNTNKSWTVADMFKFGIAPKVQAYDLKIGSLIQAQALVPEPEAVRDVYDVVLTSGRRLRVSDNHPFLTATGWKQAKDLRVDQDWVAVAANTAVGDFAPRHTDETVAFLGYMLSEGSLGGAGSSITFTQNPGPVLDRFQEIVSKIFVEPPTLYVDPNREVQSVVFSSAKHSWARLFLRSHGLLGARSQEKFVPTMFMSLPDRQTAILIGAMWDGDGSIFKRDGRPAAVYTTTSTQLATDMQRLLLRLGVPTSHKVCTTTVNGQEYPYHHVTVVTNAGRARFLKMIINGQMPTARMVDAAIQMSTLEADETDGDPIPVAWIASALADIHPRPDGASNTLSKLKREPFCFVRRRTLIEWATEGSLLQPFVDAELRWEQVASIVISGRERLYNITVPGPENFVAQDIITHNSAARFGFATLHGWKNDGEIVGIADIYQRVKAHKRFGELVGMCVNILGKQQTPNFHRSWVWPSKALVRDHRKSLAIWSSMIDMSRANGSFPRARAGCIGKYDFLCDEFDHCSQEGLPSSDDINDAT